MTNPDTTLAETSVLEMLWRKIQRPLLVWIDYGLLTHAERRHIRRCNRAKVYRQFWPRR